jgi:hypothetical protein
MTTPQGPVPPGRLPTEGETGNLLNAYGQSLYNPPVTPLPTPPVVPAPALPSPQPPPKKRAVVQPEPGGKLEQFLIANKQAHDKATEAGEAEAESKAAIKAYLLSLFEGRENELPDSFIVSADPHGRYPGYTMTLKGGFRLNTEKFKAEQSLLYVQYAEPVKASWELRESRQKGKR